jgi:mannose-6-phosphate isomerase-like protein (cupin superfamily)
MSFPFAIFRAGDAPLLDETGMMGPPEFVDDVGAKSLATGTYREKSTAAQRVTVPFCQQGAGGMSLLVGDFDPGFTVWRHSHSLDCLYFIISGEANLGGQKLGAGDGFFVPANHPYTYSAGPEGVRVLEIRNGSNFDMQVLETDMKRYIEKAEALLDARGHPQASTKP